MNDIEILEDYLKYIKQFDNNSDFIPALENLIQRNKDLEEIEKEHKEENGRLREETDKKDKIIYNLAFALADYVMYYEYDKCRNPEMIKNKAKEKIEYFTNKVEEDIKE